MDHDATDAFLALAQEKIAETHADARTAIVAASSALASLKAGVALVRAALLAMQSAESDQRITGTVVEADDTLKTIDRLTGELQATMTKVPPVMDRHVAMVQRITDLRSAVAS